MTLIVALACRDGIVVASETQATVEASGTPVRETVTKIRKVNDSMLWAAAGTVSVIQQVERRLSAFPNEVRRLGIFDLVPQVKQVVFEIRSEILGRYRALYGDDRGEQRAPASELILVGFANDSPTIIQIFPDGDYEECEPEVGYVALGIGDVFAHSILHGRNIREHSIEQGILLAYKVIKDAIEVGAYGLGEPIDIWTVKPGNPNVSIEQISPSRMQAVADAYIALKEAEGELIRPPESP